MPGLADEAQRPGARTRPGAPVDPRLLDVATIGEIIAMALSDHTSFASIRALHGLSPDQVKALMRSQLKPGSYRAWRRRVQKFGERRAHYK